jgi:SpoVK/Ycf46/Vps4 family AAA+-type ATPase
LTRAINFRCWPARERRGAGATEHFDGITVLATNLRGTLDAAFSRRMQFIVNFPDPDEPTRRLLWKQLLDQAKLLGMRHAHAATAREYRKLGRRLPEDDAVR